MERGAFILFWDGLYRLVGWKWLILIGLV